MNSSVLIPSVLRGGLPRIRRVPVKRERGMVTAEFAVIVPAVILVVLILISCIVGAQGVSRTDTAAREVSRALSLGASESEAMAIARRVAGEQAQVVIGHSGQLLSVSVSAPARGVLSYFGTTFTANHRVVVEPGVYEMSSGDNMQQGGK
ncbi:TadE/TadG family type IV pilus assembly protein [Arcanobacterium canis]|uniref:TadE family type IV pilus minor pilin n=1 Tax=Arcanobacterium canis TaxID=999183 RepID=A0ABY8G109_9ACTO|nr:TadE family type IV pilus minor pilin [Arcanobacterium canis]WFM83548.1 TadE family type IV pilus minor pilin [Arcanobacterium canis]